ncbi:MAG: lipopolysaccharide/colanic/teichoic acid biosynthesis glycosyltransferase [Bacteroidia bacterium]
MTFSTLTYVFAKRILDVIASACGIIILAPILLIIALFVVLESHGGAFYLQERIGKNGRAFTLYKFRSMAIHADKSGLLTVGRDARITKAGSFIRKYKLDELPQLFNVFLGNMSLVGPRPEVRKYVELYTADQRRVLSIKPGITDWASIKYKNENDLLANAANPEQEYINTVMPDKLSINLEYVDNRSFFTDIKIIFKTIQQILK